MNLRDLVTAIERNATDVGQVHYVVDSNFRTQAQGWSRADKTGPLDLWMEREPGYVFYTSGGPITSYATDRAAIQAAIDECVDFRGDVVLLTPGSYSIATTALALNVPDMRFLGPRVSHPNGARVLVTDAIGTNAISVDRVEVGYLRFIPLTATSIWSLSAGADQIHMHDYVHQTEDITGSTSTIFCTLAGNTNDYCLFERFSQYTDAAQGPHLSVGATVRDLVIQDFILSHGGGTTLAIALLNVTGASADGGFLIRRGKGYLRGAASTAVTNLVRLTDTGADIMSFSIEDFTGSVGFCAAGGLADLNAAETAEIGFYRNFLMTISAGTGNGTVYTA